MEGHRHEGHNYSSKHAREMWELASREPAFYMEPNESGGVTGRIVHKQTGQVLARRAKNGNRWRGEPR